jgi:AraC-like DNA-binding protein
MNGINYKRHDSDELRKAEPMTALENERHAARMQANHEELLERIARAVPIDGGARVLEGIFLVRVSSPLGLMRGVIKPSLCVIAQGSKEVLLGDSRYRYDPDHYLITTLELPLVTQILEATPEQPYLGLIMELTPALVGSVMEEVSQPSLSSNAVLGAKNARAMDVSRLDGNLQDAVVRLLRLLDSPAEVPVMMPMIKREIIYRLLLGKQGSRLRHLAVQDNNTPHITKAVERIRQDFDQPLRIEDLARELGMSVSGLHHSFKAVTAMSPLQFQKQLRLQEARRLMLSENLDASCAAYRVGYRDPAYFNREYKSLFGVPPIRHVQRLREEALVGAVG